MSLPIVAIVGRPNVGKSTLFNKIIGERKAIVGDIPGITRDRIYGIGEWLGKRFWLVDTGGFSLGEKDPIWEGIREQVLKAIEEAHLVLFVVDGKDGLLSADEEIADVIRKMNKKAILVVNKIDESKHEKFVSDFYSLGIGEIISISAESKRNLDELLDRVISLLPEEGEAELKEDLVKVAIVGKPNVGKSSLLNRIVGEERAIVHEKPGTTRDSVDSLVNYKGKDYLFVDTAGLRRRSKVKDSIEYYSTLRCLMSLEKSDIAILMLDALEPATMQDKRIAGMIEERGKGIIIIVNKIDLLPKYDANAFKDFLLKEFYFVSYAPVLFISAKTGYNVESIFPVIDKVYANWRTRIPTSQLNKVVMEALYFSPPPSDKRGRRLKIYFASQKGEAPPLFELSVNSTELVKKSYLAYLENRLREAFDFVGTPIRFKVKEH
ncbi:MAG: ribosome biogenesis GTPase Der [Synergistetes bacterium]|nr:ribosome biogenesis GTPase Der [Synergistota bacterium]MCX8127515.1 ribosome biogenesis GTPase Der [Synergistota bacterium]MDW8191568.1 ribosome biogenesis GTPase Der [Synergistota bacterium]